MLARNHTVERPRQHHDAFDRMACGLQHLVIVAVDWQVGVHVAVARMHVQRSPHAALEYALVNRHALGKDRQKRTTRKNSLQGCLELQLPAGAQGVVLQLGEQGIDVLQPTGPHATRLSHQGKCLCNSFFQQFWGRHIARVFRFAQGQIAFA